MRKILGAFALVALVAPAAFADTEHISKTVPFQPGGTLDLRTFSGHVTITGTDGNQVVVEATRHGSRDRLDHIKLDVEASGSTVYINTNHADSSWFDHWWHNDNVVDTDIEVKVPHRTNLRVRTFSAPVEATGVDGDHSVHGFSSRVRLTDVTGPMRVDTFSGPIEVRMAENARGHVTFKSFSGRFDSDVPLLLRSSSRRNVSADLGNGEGGPSLYFKTFSGGLKIVR